MPDKDSIIARGGWSRILGNRIYARCWWTACILMLECILVTALPHPWLQGQSGYTALGQPVTLDPLPFRWLQARTVTTSTIFFCVALLFFGREKLKELRWPVSPLHWGWAVLHGCVLALFVKTDYFLTNSVAPGTSLQHGVLCVWYGLLLLFPVTLGGALIYLSKPLSLIRALGNAWGLAAICDLLMMSVRSLLIIAWDRPDSWLGHRLQEATFHGVTVLLNLFYPTVFRDPGHFMVGTSVFSVIVADQCSGVEGLALMLSLTVGWLLFTRNELRLRRALLLVPIALYLSWLLNMVRIATLIAIGNAGYTAIALGGFHTQAGWILFSFVGLIFLITVNNVSWFRRAAPATVNHPVAISHAGGGVNVAAVYMLPWLAILAAGLLAQAASDGFEWLYPIRLLAALAIFFVYRSHYRQMDWRFSWLGPAAGVVVFAFWIAIDHWIGESMTGRDAAGSGVILTSIAEGLSRLSEGQRAVWIALRTVAAVVTVPLAEELAFRGYIARRFMSADVESIPYASLSLFAVVGSSLTFGILHGRIWLAGVLAGVVFATVTKLRGRLGDAVAAHATANLLLALWVITRGDYTLW